LETVKRIRTMRGMNQVDLAKASGVSQNTISEIETGRREARPATLGKLAKALGVEISDFFEESDVSPKAQRSSSPEPSLFNGLEDELHQAVYTPWLEFIDRYADRWEERIAHQVLDAGAVAEFVATLEDLGPVLRRLGLREKQEQPPDYDFTYGPTTGQVIGRLMDLLNPLIEAGAKQAEESDLERLRRRREEFASGQGRAASG
jgi:transcriptional regulator with XRE-family HTH domain